MTADIPAPRDAARVLVLNTRGEVLLLHGTATGEGWWFAPGGGLEPGERHVGAAVRELFEETGLRVRPEQLVGPVHRQVVEFVMHGRRYRQSEVFYLARVEEWAVDTSALAPLERQDIDDFRWWSAGDLRAGCERYSPADLPDLIHQLRARQLPTIATTPPKEA